VRWLDLALLAAVLAGAAIAPRLARGESSPWARAVRPGKGAPRAIGGTSGGCLDGGIAMPARGPGFRVMRLERRRHFAHRDLAAALRAIGRALAREGRAYLPLGDLSQPRGGPAPDGHASHQTGLDADIWYAPGPGGKAPVAMVDHRGARPTAAFGAAQSRALELAARDPRVDRIFVNPVIKRALCDAVTPPPGWLRKLRPWWGHDEHFHLRVRCPTDSPACVAQDPIPEGDGCAELARWLDPAAAEERASARKAYRARIGSAGAAMPEPCTALAR
jgi:penicillin-insensitive murein endopeptidase